jgi:hypothetical protein
MTTTTDIARRHGHTGPTNCQDCGTTENVHFGSWFDPKTRESGNFLQCCACGIKTGDPIYVHAECGAAAADYVPNVNSDPLGQLAFKRIQDRAIEAFLRGQQDAVDCDLEGREVYEHAVAAVLEAVGRAYAAAAINQVAEVLIDKLDEDAYVALGDVAATRDDSPQVRVFRRDAGWVMTGTTSEPCTSNHHRAQDGRPACTAVAVWRVVEEHESADGFPMLSIGFYCDTDLPEEHRAQAGVAA